MIERDLQDGGVDVGDTALMRDRSWRWLRVRILGLLDRPHGYAPDGYPMYSTRLQCALAPPRPANTDDASVH